MSTTYDKNETWDRLTLLLIVQPRKGWEDIYEEITHREVERLAPHPREVKSPAADPSERGVEDGNQLKGNSAYERILHD
jgi:hypothetical protein